MAPYPLTTSFPSKSGPYTATTSWGHPWGLVDFRVMDRGKFQTRRPEESRLFLLTCKNTLSQDPISYGFFSCLTNSFLLPGSDRPVLAVHPEQAAVEIVMVGEEGLLHLPCHGEQEDTAASSQHF